MAIDRNRIIASAQKHIQKGNYRRAIKDYYKILSEKPDDVRILLKIGDLQARAGDADDAAGTYTEVADYYVANGFFLKAVAVYKQLLKLQPDRIRVRGQLADLYVQLGLPGDATAQLERLARHHLEEDDLRGYVVALERIVEITPDDIGTRIKLGEQYSRLGDTTRAATQMRRAAGLLHDAGRYDEYVKVAERTLHLHPEDTLTLARLCRVLLDRGRANDAVPHVQTLVRLAPQDLMSAELLAKTFHLRGETDRAIDALRQLAEAHDVSGHDELRDRCWELLLEYAPDDAQAREAVGAPAPVEEIMDLEVVPVDDDTDHSAEIERLLGEVDVYLKYDLHDRAVDHLDEVFSLDPEHVGALERRSNSLEALGRNDEAAADFATIARLIADEDRESAEAWLQRALALDVDVPQIALAKAALGDTSDVEIIEFIAEPDAPDDDEDLPAFDILDAVAEAADAVDDAGDTEAAATEAPAAAISPPVPPVPSAGTGAFDDINDLFAGVEAEPRDAGGDAALDEDESFLRDLGAAFGDAASIEDDSGMGDADGDAALVLGTEDFLPAELDEALEAVDAAVEAGLVAEAHEALLELVGEWPEHAEILLVRMDQLPPMPPTGDEPVDTHAFDDRPDSLVDLFPAEASRTNLQTLSDEDDDDGLLSFDLADEDEPAEDDAGSVAEDADDEALLVFALDEDDDEAADAVESDEDEELLVFALDEDDDEAADAVESDEDEELLVFALDEDDGEAADDASAEDDADDELLTFALDEIDDDASENAPADDDDDEELLTFALDEIDDELEDGDDDASEDDDEALLVFALDEDDDDEAPESASDAASDDDEEELLVFALDEDDDASDDDDEELLSFALDEDDDDDGEAADEASDDGEVLVSFDAGDDAASDAAASDDPVFGAFDAAASDEDAVFPLAGDARPPRRDTGVESAVTSVRDDGDDLLISIEPSTVSTVADATASTESGSGSVDVFSDTMLPGVGPDDSPRTAAEPDTPDAAAAPAPAADADADADALLSFALAEVDAVATEDEAAKAADAESDALEGEDGAAVPPPLPVTNEPDPASIATDVVAPVVPDDADALPVLDATQPEEADEPEAMQALFEEPPITDEDDLAEDDFSEQTDIVDMSRALRESGARAAARDHMDDLVRAANERSGTPALDADSMQFLQSETKEREVEQTPIASLEAVKELAAVAARDGRATSGVSGVIDQMLADDAPGEEGAAAEAGGAEPPFADAASAAPPERDPADDTDAADERFRPEAEGLEVVEAMSAVPLDEANATAPPTPSTRTAPPGASVASGGGEDAAADAAGEDAADVDEDVSLDDMDELEDVSLDDMDELDVGDDPVAMMDALGEVDVSDDLAEVTSNTETSQAAIELHEIERPQAIVRDIEAPFGKPSPSVRATFGPTRAAIEAEPGGTFDMALQARMSGNAFEAMATLEPEIFGDHPVAAAFEVAVANVEMGMYFDAITSLPQLETVPELTDEDRQLVRYYLGIAHEAMAQTAEALAIFADLGRSAKARFPDARIRAKRLASGG